MVLQPLGSYVLVKPSEAEEKSPGGIILPETVQKQPAEGNVIAVGPGRILDNGERQEISVSEGDVIIYRKFGGKFGGTEITVDGEDYVLVEEDSILAIRR